MSAWMHHAAAAVAAAAGSACLHDVATAAASVAVAGKASNSLAHCAGSVRLQNHACHRCQGR